LTVRHTVSNTQRCMNTSKPTSPKDGAAAKTMSKKQDIQVYATHRGRVIQAEVLSVTDTRIRVNLQPSPFDDPREFRLPLADLKACRPVKREWSILAKDPRDRRFSRTIRIPVEFFLSDTLASISLLAGIRPTRWPE
jgi:hypothetical protein